uniref:Uncharacterized protein n=1 Tax=Anguilla anguilla TaxID=7936 RepID=A0A0E9UNQ4_ANGAN
MTCKPFFGDSVQILFLNSCVRPILWCFHCGAFASSTHTFSDSLWGFLIQAPPATMISTASYTYSHKTS